MNRDDIIRMAREAGIGPVYGNDSIERFAALVAAHERNSAIEQCERLKWKPRKSEYLEGMDAAYDNVIKWLRARGEK